MGKNAKTWNPQVVVEKLEADPDLTFVALSKQEAADSGRNVYALRKCYSEWISDPTWGARLRELVEGKVQAGYSLVYESPEGIDYNDRPARWLTEYSRTHHRGMACKAAQCHVKHVESWLDPAHEKYDPLFAAEYALVEADIVASYVDDIHEARTMAKATGDANTLSKIAFRTLESLDPKKWGRQVQVQGQIAHHHQHELTAATHAQLAERTGRLLTSGVIEGEVIP